MPWNSHVPPAVLCNLSFRDFICATKVRLEYSVEIFLSPGIAGAERIYKCHGFPGEPSEWNKSKYLEDVFVSHKMEQLQEYDHHLAWATVYNVLDQYRENIRWQNTYFRDYGFSF
uniref:SSN3 protein n=2 Tax=Fopius arisanus TaxID=64838 RepID=A0A0C9PL73_9HYME